MINSLTISRFKCFLEFRLPELSRLTLIGGENSVGKTSLLEAVFLFFGRQSEDILIRLLGWRGMPAVGLNPEDLFAPFFFDYDMQKEIGLSLVMDKRLERLEISFLSDERVKQIPTQESGKSGRPPFVTTDIRALTPGALCFQYHGPRKQSQDTYLVLGRDGLALRGRAERKEDRAGVFLQTRRPIEPTEDAARFGRMDKLGMVEETVEFLKGFYPYLRGLSLIPGVDGRPLVHADVGLARKVPVGYVGDGFSRLLSIYLAIANCRDGVLLVDEIGGGIHYSALAKVWQAVAAAAAKYNCQVISTTHSYECIQAAKEGLEQLLEPDFTYVRLDRTDKGIVPKCYSHKVLGAAVESGWEVR